MGFAPMNSSHPAEWTACSDSLRPLCKTMLHFGKAPAAIIEAFNYLLSAWLADTVEEVE
jgi:hypothetical protein